ncbi:hypothetical protein [Stutzerimonas nitrititolerans]|uniref:hypothetical protein n=1 Tax=Stutzerimonas nitrititolerans TaxID=2482751 RepID=UPI00289A42FC|nr:hypothetical protein [Stutzerimonas nitrititolerans]
MSKEVKRYRLDFNDYGMENNSEFVLASDYDALSALSADQAAAITIMAKHCKKLETERDALLAERDALKAEQALWEPIHYEVHRRAEKEWCLSSGCDFTVTVMHDDYAAIDAALQGEQP